MDVVAPEAHHANVPLSSIFPQNSTFEKDAV